MKNLVGMRKEDDAHATRVVVGMATCGIAAGARPVLTAFAQEINKQGLAHVTVAQMGCLGMCKYEPMVIVTVPGQKKVTYIKMNPEKAVRVVNEHIVGGRVCTEYTLDAVQE